MTSLKIDDITYIEDAESTDILGGRYTRLSVKIAVDSDFNSKVTVSKNGAGVIYGYGAAVAYGISINGKALAGASVSVS